MPIVWLLPTWQGQAQLRLIGVARFLVARAPRYDGIGF
jgi:hypothetical protein